MGRRGLMGSAAIAPSAVRTPPNPGPLRVFLTHPTNGTPLFGRDGRRAYVDLWTLSSARFAAYVARHPPGLAVQNPSTQESVAAAISTLAALTAAWCLVDRNGSSRNAPCTEENAFGIYSDTDWFWLVEQLIKAIKAHG